MEELLQILSETQIPLHTITLQKGNHRSRHLSAICFREAITSQRMARSITR